MRVRSSISVLLAAAALVAAAGPPVHAAEASPPAAAPPHLTVTEPARVSIRCFWLEPADQVQRALRRYTPDHRGSTYTCADGWHEAFLPIDTVPAVFVESERGRLLGAHDSDITDTDPRWPATCDRCSFAFGAEHRRQVFTQLLYRRTDTGALLTLRDAPAGAMWDAWWYPANGAWRGADGRALIVKTPGGEWHVDGRASNCTMPTDCEHKCWVRHGEPPNVTVDKNGRTCGAGAGSILAGSYHGFLRQGQLVPA